MGENRKHNHLPKPISLKDFHSKRNQILLWHDKGGLGDVFMQRMLFEDFHEIVPNAELVFACLPEYTDAAKDHPHISRVLDSRTVNVNEYCVHYNTCVSIADRYENRKAPCLEHRSDIWAKYCGVELKRHDMCFRLSPTLRADCAKRILGMARKDAPTILFAPVSKMVAKNLLPWQIKVIVDATKDCNLLGIHKSEIEELTKLGIQGIYGEPLWHWMHYMDAADYVISVDTAAFHLAGGLKKPLMGIFSFADGKAYGKYFDFVLVQKHRDNGNWDCGPCFKFGDCPKCKRLPKPCITELSQEELETGVRNMLERWPWKKVQNTSLIWRKSG